MEMGVSAFQSAHKQLRGVSNLGKHEWLPSGFPTNKASFQLIYSFIFETGPNILNTINTFITALKKWKNV